MSSSQEKKDQEKEEGSIQKAKRIAIVVGINEYQEKDEIPTLAGAENDAKELRKILIANNNFKVIDDQFLIGEDATRTAILRAISDVSHNATEAELVLFYFSGHGIVDENSEGYIAPYDMYAKDPFVSGIKMEDLRHAIERTARKASVATILDCCYAGIVTKGTKAILSSANMKNIENVYTAKVRKLAESGAIYVLASSEADRKSREINDCVHAYDRNPHPHGAFSFHLLEGLSGAAADEKGIITFSSLKGHIRKMMTSEGKQYPIASETETGPFEVISLGIKQEVFAKNVSGLVIDIQKLLGVEYDTSSISPKVQNAPTFIQITDLEKAATKINNLSAVDPNNTNLPDLVAGLNDRLRQYNQALTDWLNNENNVSNAGSEINKISPYLYSVHFYEICEKLNYEGFRDLIKNKSDKLYLIHLTPEIELRTEYTSQNRQKLNRLLSKLSSVKKVGQEEGNTGEHHTHE
jgi:hypothetical protein